MTRTDVINHILKTKLSYKASYLEIGLNMPDKNYFNVQCAYKESVDPFSGPCTDFSGDMDWVINNVLTYRQTSDEFFETHDKKYDLIFIDGLHIADQVARDIGNAYNHLNSGGYIVVHDCLPISKESQSEERTPGDWNGTVWKAIPNLYKAGLDYFIVDTNYGCGVIKHTGEKNFDKYTITNLEYDDVFSNFEVRNTIMHVVSVEEFLKI